MEHLLNELVLSQFFALRQKNSIQLPETEQPISLKLKLLLSLVVNWALRVSRNSWCFLEHF